MTAVDPSIVGASSGPVASTPSTSSRSQVRQAWAVHLFTTLGALVGMLALEAVFDRRAKAVMVYLLVTQIIDGIDGPMARSVDIENRVPKIDGYVLDLVIDYVTCVIVPAAFLHRFGLLPSSVSLPIVCLVVFLSAIWFSRTDMMTEDDHWFNGFPATWNMVAPSMLVLGTPKWANAIAVVLLCGLLLTNVKFPHPVRSDGMRTATLVMTAVWLTALLVASIRFGKSSWIINAVLVVCFGYFAGLSTWRTRLERNKGISKT